MGVCQDVCTSSACCVRSVWPFPPFMLVVILCHNKATFYSQHGLALPFLTPVAKEGLG